MGESSAVGAVSIPKSVAGFSLRAVRNGGFALTSPRSLAAGGGSGGGGGGDPPPGSFGDEPYREPSFPSRPRAAATVAAARGWRASWRGGAGNETVARALQSSPEITWSGQSTACAAAQDCTSCAQLYPSCAWCGASGQCLETSAPLREHIAKYPDIHVLYSDEEYMLSYGGSYSALQVNEDDRCGSWVFNERSCPHIEAYCSPFTTCGSCTAVGACGFCYEGSGGEGRCLPGTRSGEIALRSGTQLCTAASSSSTSSPPSSAAALPGGGSEAASVQRPMAWIFGNWSEYYRTGTWNSVCVERCGIQQDTFALGSGRLSVGSRVDQVAYAPGARCSWKIEPASWPSDRILYLSMELDALVRLGDSVRIYDAPSGQWLPGQELGHLGCRGSSEACYVRNGFPVTSSVLVQFYSVPEGSSWTLTWEFVSKDDARVSTRSASQGDYGIGSWLLWFGAALLLVPLVIAIFFARFRCRRYMMGQDHERNQPPIALDVAAADLILAARQTDQGIDVEAMEQHCPATKSAQIGDEDKDKTCSVCLAELEVGQEGRRLPCNHFFHQPCIDDWLRRNAACPVCRAQVLPPGLPRRLGHFASARAAGGASNAVATQTGAEPTIIGAATVEGTEAPDAASTSGPSPPNGASSAPASASTADATPPSAASAPSAAAAAQSAAAAAQAAAVAAPRALLTTLEVSAPAPAVDTGPTPEGAGASANSAAPSSVIFSPSPAPAAATSEASASTAVGMPPTAPPRRTLRAGVGRTVVTPERVAPVQVPEPADPPDGGTRAPAAAACDTVAASAVIGALMS
mmetsp:Transcript_49585/g.160302  ORF Transcript_49585/g.160302 Transcript_49585/m.160302 type:complete len:803 (+) Transcript_49585:48-2456(+)|eukprot:CAMPEP_0203923856 /NCGR_PEP_ID=MMETSP0359-20131031/63675_1 /ASSEMBLY_ACC=CAM_ASM_000338 /TAXON_ID=268821 /ORGANISM="Scrippsiella Hangoei, Strain SHTV-5" /LENGTH=802 /DNA_ID=CAMNT_0050851987 /DNA_START=32 /DNA_END=2440 /DNA_ORIENTATION=+